MTLHVLYSCNAWHEQSSRILLGVFRDRDDLCNKLNRSLLDNGEPGLSDEDFAMLHNFGQTQKYEGDGEFIIETVTEGDVNEDLL